MWNDIPSGRLCTPRSRIDPTGYGELFVSGVGQIPDEFALLLGEMLYQLRSALDACIYQAAIYATQDPPTNEGAREFPITENLDEWPKLRDRRLDGLHVDIQNAIERVQPYHAKNLSPEQCLKDIGRHLGILHNLARKDRHRRLHVVGSWPYDLAPAFTLPPGATVESIEIQKPSVLADGVILAKFRIKNLPRANEAFVNPRLRTNFGCSESPVSCHPEDTFDNRLAQMINAVASVLSAFERQF
jgi:hypothetical protein